MALSFPLALADLFDGLQIAEITFDLPESVGKSGETGAGEILTYDLGAQLWRGDVTVAQRNHLDAKAMGAKVSLLRKAGRSFFVYDIAAPGPRFDPDGAILGAADIKIQSIASNNRDVVFYNFPTGYELASGDKIAFIYGANPARYALHQVVTGGVANGAGQLAVELDPFIRSGATADLSVTLIKPVCKAVYVPGSFTPGTSSGVTTSGFKFSWQQTLR